MIKIIYNSFLFLLLVIPLKAQQLDKCKSLIPYINWYQKLSPSFDPNSETDCELKSFHRWLDIWYNEMGPEFQTTESDYLFNQLIQSKANLLESNPVKWKSLGPNNAPNGIGRLNCVAFHPQDTNILYCGAPNGGFWISKNKGKNWITTTDDFASIGISHIAIDPLNPNHIYVATGDKDLWSSNSVGILESFDSGLHWKTTGLKFTRKDNKILIKILIDPSNPKNLITATNEEIFKSTDGGNTWISKYVVEEISDMEFHPLDPSILYVGTNKGQVLKSIDKGETFQNISKNVPFVDTTKIERITLAVTNAAPNQLILMAQGEPSNNPTAGIYISYNQGTSFKKRADNSNSTVLNWYGYTLDVSPVDSSVMYCGGGYLFMSKDAGKNWKQVHQAGNNNLDGSFIHVDMHDVRFNKNEIYVCCDGGLYYSKDTANYWNYISGDMVIGQSYGFGSSIKEPNFFVSGFQDLGSGWIIDHNYTIRFGGDGMECLVDPIDKNIFYLSSQLGYIDKTIDGGKNFVNFISTPKINEYGAWTTPYLLSQERPMTAYAGFQNVWKTYDGGDHWKQLSKLTNDITIKRIAVAPSDSNVIFAIKEWGNGIYRTLNGGKNWDLISYPENYGIFDNLAIHPLDPQHIVVVGIGYYEQKKCFESFDAGTTWINISESLPNVSYASIVYQSISPYRLFVGGEAGVYYRNMNNWEKIGDGLPNVDIKKLEYNSSNNILRAGTYGRGIWELNLDELFLNTKSNSLEKASNVIIIPNPTTGKINLIFDNELPNQLFVYNSKGQVLLANNKFGPNPFFDFSDLDNGLYFIKFIYSSHILVKTFILSK